MMRTAIAPTGIAIARPARAPATKDSVNPAALDSWQRRERCRGHDSARERDGDTGQRPEEVVLREVAVVELAEPGQRLRGDDKSDGRGRAAQDEHDDEQPLED